MKAPKTKRTKRTLKSSILPRSDGKAGKGTDFSWHTKFVKLLGTNANVRAACSGCGVGRTTAHEHYHRFPDFAAAWDEAIESGLDNLFTVAMDHAANGTRRPIYHQGKCVGHATEHDHRLLEWILSRKRPNEFGDRKRIDLSAQVNRMTEEEEVQAHHEAMESITATIRLAAMRGVPRAC